MNFVEETKCRVCSGKLNIVFNLGSLFVSDFIKEDEIGSKAPLALAECDTCGLIQLKHTINLDSMYRKYWYRSGLNKSMRKDLEDVVRAVERTRYIPDNSIVVDIGCNDGTMFDFYKNKNIIKIGFDPANNLASAAWEHCNLFVNDYFSSKNYEFDKASVVTSIAMFYDLPDPNSFVADVKKILAPDGIWVIQFTDLYSMLKINAIDNICGEHLEYYKLWDLVYLLKLHGLKVFDCEYNMVNGGSLRVYACHENDPLSFEETDRFYEAIKKENEYFKVGNQMELFKRRISEIKEKTCSFIHLVNDGERKIYALAASTKANTLLQAFGLSNNDIVAIGEINKEKYGLITSGSRIPIISEKELFAAKPNLVVILAWHFTETFNKVTEKFIEEGGYVLYPLPLPYVMHKEGNFYL
jgi:NDP-4-keto-2,6-dideoxyhexose 3-C-methyltransferase